MELRDYIRGLRRHWLAVLLMTLVGVATAFGWYLIQTPVYEATAVGLVQTRTVAVEDEENREPRLEPGIRQLRQRQGTHLHRNGDVEARRRWRGRGCRNRRPRRTGRLSHLDREPRRTPTSSASPRRRVRRLMPWLSRRRGWPRSSTAIDTYEGDGTAGSSPVTITVDQSAVVPTTPIFPDLQTSLIVGGVLGLGVGIAFALMRTVSDRRIRAADDVESRTGLPVVGTHPADRDPRRQQAVRRRCDERTRARDSPSRRRCGRSGRTCSSWTSTTRLARSS